MVIASSSVKPWPRQSKYDSFLLSLIFFSSFAFVFGGVANKLGAAVVAFVGAFGSK
jgi:hypothetical protein